MENSNIRVILVLLTPFQVSQIKKISDIYRSFVGKEAMVFFKPKTLSMEVIKSSLSESLKIIDYVKLPSSDPSFPGLLRNPVKEILKARALVVRNREIVRKVIPKSFKFDVYIGSEKELFTQMLIEALDLENKLNKLNSVDEGTGFYRKLTFIDQLKSSLYKRFAHGLLGFNYRYYSTLGTHYRIDNLYSRFPEFLPYRNEGVRYFSLSQSLLKQSRDNEVGLSQKALFFTAPFSEKGKLPLERELELVSWTLEFCKKNAIHLFIKQHPRELSDKYSQIDGLQYVDKSVSAESLDYFEYRILINYGSSLVLDVYEVGYPLANVVTFNNRISNSVLKFVFEKTNLIDTKCRKSEFVECLSKVISNVGNHHL